MDSFLVQSRYVILCDKTAIYGHLDNNIMFPVCCGILSHLVIKFNNYPRADFDIGCQMGTIVRRCCTMALRADQHLTHLFRLHEP